MPEIMRRLEVVENHPHSLRVVGKKKAAGLETILACSCGFPVFGSLRCHRKQSCKSSSFPQPGPTMILTQPLRSLTSIGRSEKSVAAGARQMGRSCKATLRLLRQPRAK